MGGTESHSTTILTVISPETQEQLDNLKAALANFKKEAIEKGDPEHFNEHATKLFDTFVDTLPSLKLTENIQKSTGDSHIGIIGPISSGKTTFINTLFGINLPTALGHCTNSCDIVHTIKENDGTTFWWDVPGKNSDYRFYKPENLCFLKSLDTIIILFDNDISMIQDIIRVVTAVSTGKLIVIRTKIDQHMDGSRTIEQERVLDTDKLRKYTNAQLYYISSHNVKLGGDRELYDWKELKKDLGI